MEKTKVEYGPNSIEEIVCVPFDKVQRVPMTKELTGMLIQMLMADPKPTKDVPEKEKPFLYALIEKRVKFAFQYKIDDARVILLISLVAKSPGTAVLYLWYLQYLAKRDKIEVISMDYFIETGFPFGFPTDESLHQIWDNQKFINGNLVDHAQYGKSLLIGDEVRNED